MEPMTGFATIVGLLSAYRQHRTGVTQPDLEDFKEWLEEHSLAQIAGELDRNAALAAQISATLEQGLDGITAQLSRIERNLAAIVGGEPGFSGMADILLPSARLSDQAVALLVAFERSGAGIGIDTSSLSGASLLLSGESVNEGFGPPDPRFWEDDLGTLVELGLLRLDLNKSGRRVFRFTRVGSEVARKLQSVLGSD